MIGKTVNKRIVSENLQCSHCEEAKSAERLLSPQKIQTNTSLSHEAMDNTELGDMPCFIISCHATFHPAGEDETW